MGLQNVVSDVLFDVVGERYIRHCRVCIVNISLEFILTPICLHQQIEVDSEQDSVENGVYDVNDDKTEHLSF
jgi:hypothetical protein